ncbi:hypothetical protein J1N35_022179 [Gossypium stocksii]|uniref:Secreted protein n=1 Tax=Gossypium stocksii TaxID=47602 RepID=A0A9D4A211_9ROSI|nr:hypothetical protein J1N35_022179 [Gossypium stocksii]
MGLLVWWLSSVLVWKRSLKCSEMLRIRNVVRSSGVIGSDCIANPYQVCTQNVENTSRQKTKKFLLTPHERVIAHVVSRVTEHGHVIDGPGCARMAWAHDMAV